MGLRIPRIFCDVSLAIVIVNYVIICTMQGTQAAFDIFYNRVLDMLDSFYPVSSISISSRDLLL